MKARTAALLFGLLALLGFTDALYLTWDHFQALSDPAFGGGLCGAGGACEISRTSAASEIPLGGLGPGLPIALVALGFYVSFGLLTLTRWRRPDAPHAGRLMLALAVLSSGYSIALGVLSLIIQGSLCPLCTVLYVINLGLLGVAMASRTEPLRASVRGVWGSILSRAGGLATATFLLVIVGGYLIYATNLSDRRASGVMGQPRHEVVVHDSDRSSVGPTDAPVHIIEFADIQCPHCRTLFETLEEVRAKRPDKIRLTFMHFPLDQACNRMVTRPFHRRACELAKIASCAGAQGKLFEVTGALMKSQHGASDADLANILRGLGVNMALLNRCVADPATEARVKADIEEGLKQGITGTPVFFVNGHKSSGARPADYIDDLVDRALEQASGHDGAR